jgi:hypothetical protein
MRRTLFARILLTCRPPPHAKPAERRCLKPSTGRVRSRKTIFGLSGLPWNATAILRDPCGHRRRRSGRSVSRKGYQIAAGCSDQSMVASFCKRSGSHGAIRARGQGAGLPQPSGSRGHLWRRRRELVEWEMVSGLYPSTPSCITRGRLPRRSTHERDARRFVLAAFSTCVLANSRQATNRQLGFVNAAPSGRIRLQVTSHHEGVPFT